MRAHSRAGVRIRHAEFRNLSCPALAGVALWTERWPVNQRDTPTIPSQGTYLRCGLGPQLGACKRQQIVASFPLSLPFLLSKSK